MNRTLFLLALLSVAAPAGTNTFSFLVPISNTFAVGGEQVAFTGRAHILTRFTPVDPCASCQVDVHINLQNVTGVGQTSGGIYRAVGATETSGVTAIPGMLAVTGPGLKIVPPNPVTPVDPCRIDLVLQFGVGGPPTVVSADLAPFSCGVDACP